MADEYSDLINFSDSDSDEYSTDGNPVVSRVRRTVPETGSFGKSTRRSRSRTGTPAAKREDPTLAAADAIFSSFLAQKASEQADLPQRKTTQPSSQTNQLSNAPLSQIDGNAGPTSRFSKKEAHKEPTEVILRGFHSSQQYAAIREYERIGGRICEDYPRDAPVEQRRFKTDLRDQAALRRQPMTAEERAKALKFAGGEHWIKITFESAEAAEIALESSPQPIQGNLVYAELYRGCAPTSDEAISATGKPTTPRKERQQVQSLGTTSGYNAQRTSRRPSSTLPRSYNAPAFGQNQSSFSPTGSNTSSYTMDTGTVASTTSSDTIRPSVEAGEDLMFCSRIKTAKRAKLLPAQEALLPQVSPLRQFWSSIPVIGWLSSDIIGSQVPRTDQGEFDWEKASLYWKMIYYIDSLTGWFDVSGNDKDD